VFKTDVTIYKAHLWILSHGHKCTFAPVAHHTNAKAAKQLCACVVLRSLWMKTFFGAVKEFFKTECTIECLLTCTVGWSALLVHLGKEIGVVMKDLRASIIPLVSDKVSDQC